MIERDPGRATAREYDVAVVGAGIHGCMSALAAARRGLQVLVLDRGDFGGATSWNSLRIVHGGLRYLQTMDLVRFRRSVQARSIYVAEFPSLIDPLACLMPLYGRGLKRPSTLAPVLALNEVLRRLWASPAERALIPGSRVIGPGRVRERFPGVRPDGLVAGALWHDAYLTQPQRVVMETVRRLVALGGTALNYVDVLDVAAGPEGRVAGLRVRDLVAGGEHEVRARTVLNCTGPWAREVDAVSQAPPSLAFNLLLDRPLDAEVAVAVEPVAGGRTYFLRPLGDRTMAGTYHAAAESADDSPTDRQIGDFLADLRDAMPGFPVNEGDVLRVLSGVLPAKSAGSDAIAVRDEWREGKAAGGPSGLFTLVGVKYTTAPLSAARAAERIVERCFAARQPRPPVDQPVIPVRPVPSWPAFREMARTDAERAAALVRGMVEEESVTSMEDLVLRRTDWGLAPDQAAEASQRLRSLCPDSFSDAG